MKFLIADDHALFRDGLKHLLSDIDADAELMESGNFQDTLAAAVAHPETALLLLDLRMPGMIGLGSVRKLMDAAPTIPILMISAIEDPQEIQQALDIGVMGYLPKSESTTVMQHAIQLVLSGGVYISPALLPSLRGSPDVLLGQLTPRQVDVLRRMATGCNNKEIARELGLSVATVKAHLGAIFRTLDVSSRAQAMIKAGRLGLLPSSD